MFFNNLLSVHRFLSLCVHENNIIKRVIKIGFPAHCILKRWAPRQSLAQSYKPCLSLLHRDSKGIRVEICRVREYGSKRLAHSPGISQTPLRLCGGEITENKNELGVHTAYYGNYSIKWGRILN